MKAYEPLGCIGEGAYGVVIKARKRSTGETVAIKRLRDTEEDEKSRKAIHREIRMLHTLRFPYIVELLEVFRRKKKVYLVFEYCPKTLLQIIEKSDNGMAVDEIKMFTHQLLLALDHMHKNHAIHRDVKPENCLLGLDGKLRLCDFGFARKDAKNMTEYVSTRWYRAPELLLNKEYSACVDIWAVGCLVAEMLTGEPLFPGDSDIDMLYLIQGTLGSLPREVYGDAGRAKFSMDTRSSIRMKFRHYPPDVVDLLLCCLHLDSRRRPTAQQALHHPFFDGLPTSLTMRNTATSHTSPTHASQVQTEIPNIHRTVALSNTRKVGSRRNSLMEVAASPSVKHSRQQEEEDTFKLPTLKTSVVQMEMNSLPPALLPGIIPNSHSKPSKRRKKKN
ncbi:hypothetical protein PCE1_004504 [Barthelona sp. PCE]